MVRINIKIVVVLSCNQKVNILFVPLFTNIFLCGRYLLNLKRVWQRYFFLFYKSDKNTTKIKKSLVAGISNLKKNNRSQRAKEASRQNQYTASTSSYEFNNMQYLFLQRKLIRKL